MNLESEAAAIPPIVVVGALAGAGGSRDDASVLLARRAPGQRHAGLWELPGGKVEPGEAPDSALLRELREELGLESRISGPPRRYESTVEGRGFVFIVFPVLLDGEPELRVHDAIAVVKPGDVRSYELAPLDAPALADWAADNHA